MSPLQQSVYNSNNNNRQTLQNILQQNRVLYTVKAQQPNNKSNNYSSSNSNINNKINSNNNNNNIYSQEMDEDEVVKQLMTMLGNKKQLQIKSADGKLIKLSVDFMQECEEYSILNNLETQLNGNLNDNYNQNENEGKDIAIPKLRDEDQEYRKFQKILQQATTQIQILPIKNISDQSTINSAKKISLSSKRTKSSNQAVLQFIEKPKKSISSTPSSSFTAPMAPISPCVPSSASSSVPCSTPCSFPLSNSSISPTLPTSALIITTKQTVTESIQFLRQTHPEDQQHLEIITKRMFELQKMQQDKIKLDQQISSILSASFSNSISGLSGMKFDNSIDGSMISIGSLSGIGIAISDPLCQIFNNYIKKNVVDKKISGGKTPSFLYMYSQPMIDEKGNQINDQINYFQQQTIIQKALKQCKINYIKQQGTIDKFNYWIKQNISILHFCGHGVPDNLLFEGLAGTSVNLSSEKLENMLKYMGNPLELVFVASCHSESTGKIFRNAGVQHVICVKDQYAIEDQACHQFARIFYRSVINDRMSICDAFNFAKKQLTLSQKFTPHQCSKFLLIKSHPDQICSPLSLSLSQQSFHNLTPVPTWHKPLPSRVENFIPRPKSLHQVLKLLSSRNRFITITGHSGIGKSTFVRQLVRYLQFRNVYKDGVIYIDIRSCEKMLKIYENFGMEIFGDGGFGKLGKGFGENLQKVVKEIGDRELLIVMDNCQSVMMGQERNQFKRFIEGMMKNCDNVHFVFTNRTGIGRQIDYCSEKLYQLRRLSDSQAETLFFLRVPRVIQKAQLQQFLKIGEVIDFSKHPFFQFLNGHPEAVCMTASLLSDRSLCQLYELLMKPRLEKILPKQKIDQDDANGVNPLVETAMKISLNVLKNKYKDSSEMIKALSLLPVGAESETMSKLFGPKWKETSKRLIDHSLIHSRQIAGSKYFAVHPYIIIYIESQITQEEKIKYHEKICQEFLKRIDKVYRHVGTLSQSSQKAQEQFFVEQQNYKAIILRQLSFYGQKSKIRKLYHNLFQADYSDDQFLDKQQQNLSIKMKTQAIDCINKKRVYNQKILQPTKKDPITLLLVYYATILFVTKSPTCHQYIQLGVILSRMRNKLISQANLLRIKACLHLLKNKYIEAKQSFFKSWELYAIEGCGLGASSCQSAIGYIRFMEEEYAPAKKNMENALKYYDSIAHPFGKHYLNRWLCNLKTKMNRTEKQLMSHREEAQKLLKQTKLSLKSSNINNTSLVKHKLGIFVFRFAFDNISLFLQASFQVDVRPKIINQVTLKKAQDRGSKIHEQANNEQQQILVSLNKNENKNQANKKNPYKRK